jgi:hypothetical protein
MSSIHQWSGDMLGRGLDSGMAKECPQCQALAYNDAYRCDSCGHTFTEEQRELKGAFDDTIALFGAAAVALGLVIALFMFAHR